MPPGIELIGIGLVQLSENSESKMNCGSVATASVRCIGSDGAWMNVEGDQNSPSLGKENLPCNIENCYDGMLILKFTDEDGRDTVYPVGSEFIFKAPLNGVITYGINDDTFYDNIWYQAGGLIDHASVELSPR